MPGLKKFSNVDVTDIEGVSSASSIAKINGVELFGSPLILRLTIANDGDSWDPTIRMNSGTGVIDWGDGTPTESIGILGVPAHTYATAGTYDVTLSPFKSSQTRAFGLSNFDTPDTQVTEVLAFGDCGSVGFRRWQSLVTIPLNGYLDLTGIEFFQSNLFRECSFFVGPTSMSGYASLDASSSLFAMFQSAASFNGPGLNDLDTSSVTTLNEAFLNAELFNQDISGWEVGAVIEMRGVFRDAISFDQPLNSWDVSGVEDMQSMFNNASSFNQPLNSWVVSSVEDMGAMFRGASSFNQDISGWDVGAASSIAAMFAEASSFNQPLNSWDVSSARFMGVMFKDTPFDQPLNNWVVSSAEDMASMFSGSSFNQDISGWDVSSVKSIRRMFFDSPFDQPLNSWVVSAVTNMEGVFRDASSFNQPLNSWDVSLVEDMQYMFSSANSFDQPLNNWVVSSVIKMNNMFERAFAFNQDISGWDVSGVDVMNNMFEVASSFDQNLGAWQFKNNAIGSSFFDGSGMSDANVALCLEGWDSIGQGTGVDMTNMFGTIPRTLSQSTYSAAKAAYDNLIATYSWDLTNSITWVA